MKRLILLFCLGILIGCNPVYVYEPTLIYNFTAQHQEGLKPDTSYTICYEDIYISFLGKVERRGQYYRGINFTIQNKTDSMITLDWNKVSFMDPSGSWGNQVMHEGVKYNERMLMKPPTVIPPKKSATDIIIPNYAVSFYNGEYLKDWLVQMVSYKPAVGVTTKLGFFMPLQIGTIAKNYTFEVMGVGATNPKYKPRRIN
jgi:hypothetical protein